MISKFLPGIFQSGKAGSSTGLHSGKETKPEPSPDASAGMDEGAYRPMPEDHAPDRRVQLEEPAEGFVSSRKPTLAEIMKAKDEVFAVREFASQQNYEQRQAKTAGGGSESGVDTSGLEDKTASEPKKGWYFSSSEVPPWTTGFETPIADSSGGTIKVHSQGGNWNGPLFVGEG